MWSILIFSMLLNSSSWMYFFFFFFFFFFFDFSWPLIINYYYFFDVFKFFLFYLSFLIFFFMIYLVYNYQSLLTITSLLFVFLFSCFLVNDFMLFYVFFELSLLPIVYMMFCWGLQPERIEASIYFLLYALIGSFPLLAKILYAGYFLGSLNFIIKFCWNFHIFCCFLNNYFLVFFWMFSFVIKLPIYGLHLWLPKAHVEAPVWGSMVLAAIMLKLGAYGLFRLSNYNLLLKTEFLLVWVIVTSFWVSVMSYRSVDVKSLIAYSSISHMSYSLLLLSFFFDISFFGIIVLLVGHGFVSSKMFFIFNSLYQISNSRSMLLNKSFSIYSKLFFFFFFFVLMFKSSFPINLTFYSEFVVSMLLFIFNPILLVFFIFSIFFIGFYKIKLFLIFKHGYSLTNINNNSNIYIINFLSSSISFFHLFFKVFSLMFFFLWFLV